MYTFTWKKYLPVIRLLLKRSAAGEQTVKLDRIDFEKGSKIRKPLCSFNVEIVRGRLGYSNQSVPARDLLEILQGDETSRNLLRDNQYAVSLSSDFQLVIRNITPVEASGEAGGDENE
jgi:hypothetical protein